MESIPESSTHRAVDLPALFSGLVRLETELWGLVDHRLRSDHELPLSWFEPMQVIERVSDCRVADIAETLSITVGGASKLVDRIERAGMCSRAPNPDDARSSLISLTPRGRRILNAAHASFEHELDIWLGAAAPAERLASMSSTVRDVRHHIADQQGGAR